MSNHSTGTCRGGSIQDTSSHTIIRQLFSELPCPRRTNSNNRNMRRRAKTIIREVVSELIRAA